MAEWIGLLASTTEYSTFKHRRSQKRIGTLTTKNANRHIRKEKDLEASERKAETIAHPNLVSTPNSATEEAGIAGTPSRLSVESQ